MKINLNEVKMKRQDSQLADDLNDDKQQSQAMLVPMKMKITRIL